MLFILVMAKQNFQQPLLKHLHDPSEIIQIFRFCAQVPFLIIVKVENSCTAPYFLLKPGYIFLKIIL